MRNSHAVRLGFASGFCAATLILLCATAASPNPPQVRDKKKVFTEEDLKVDKLRGKAMVAAMVDWGQINDPSSQAVVSAINTASGQSQYVGRIKITQVKISNRSPKIIRAVQLRWAITDRGEPPAVLLEGTTPFFDVLIKPRAKPAVEIPPIYLNKVVKPLLKGGELNGDLHIVVGVQEVRFADGSSWQRAQPSSSLKRNLDGDAWPGTGSQYLGRPFSLSPLLEKGV
jgi:hypothetical protein